MKNAKKLLSILILGTVICTHAYNDYQTCYATEAVVAGGLASAGVALLGLGAIAGVGMELDNNRRFNELSDEEKERIENGLASNFEDVALQRGASIEKIKNWTTDLCNGVLDKASECWGIFKDWIKSVSITDENVEDIVTSNGSFGYQVVLPFSVSYNFLGVSYMYTISPDTLESGSSSIDSLIHGDYDGIRISDLGQRDGYGMVQITTYKLSSNNLVNLEYYTFYKDLRNTSSNWLCNYFNRGNSSLPVDVRYNVGRDVNFKYIFNNKIQAVNNGQTTTNYGFDTLFSTNTDYLEKLKGQDEDVIDVIDVTDIKNPIIESRPNSLARIDWNRGTRRTNNNNDDDDNKMVTGLVPMDVWYEQIDDEQEQMQNAVVVYDNYIQEHPEEKDTYFISTTPVTNINNYFNTLPVVNIPATGTIVNNNYEYNNYNNNNVTIYQEPYSAGIIPTFPDFSKKFPFCIPFDLYEFFVVFLAEKEAPKIEVPFPVLDNTNHQLTVEHITIDLSGYEYLSDVLRVMLFVLFCVGLMILTRQLIKG